MTSWPAASFCWSVGVSTSARYSTCVSVACGCASIFELCAGLTGRPQPLAGGLPEVGHGVQPFASSGDHGQSLSGPIARPRFDVIDDRSSGAR